MLGTLQVQQKFNHMCTDSNRNEPMHLFIMMYLPTILLERLCDQFVLTNNIGASWMLIKLTIRYTVKF